MFHYSRSRSTGFSSGFIRNFSSGTDRKLRISFVAALVLTISLIAVTGISNANANEGNQNPDCAITGNLFEQRATAFKTFRAFVNDKEVELSSSNISSHVKQGDTVRIEFELKEECNDTYVSLASFKVISSTKPRGYEAFEVKDGAYPSGALQALEVTAPTCDFHIAASSGGRYAPDHANFSKNGRLIFSATGGTEACTPPAAPKEEPKSEPVEKPKDKPKTPATTTPATKPTTPATTAPTSNTRAPHAFVTASCISGEVSARASVSNPTDKPVNAEVVVSGDKGTTSVTNQIGARETAIVSREDVNNAIKEVSSSASSPVELHVKLDGERYGHATATASCRTTQTTETDKPKPQEPKEPSNTPNNKPKDKPQDKPKTPESKPANTTPKHSTVAITEACDTAAGAGAVIAIENHGDTQDTFHIYRDGKEVTGSPFTVEAGKTARKLLSLEEDSTSRITVENGSGTVVKKQRVTINCKPESEVVYVQNKPKPEPQPELALTGAPVAPWVLLGGVTLIFGTHFLLRARAIRTRNVGWISGPELDVRP